MSFTLYHADCTGQPSNCLYPHQVIVSDAASLKEAVGHDYVCAAYKDSYRSNDNFQQMDCFGMDCDNEHSENPADWVTPQAVRELIPDTAYAVHYSRNHMKPKNGKAPRPKFHLILMTGVITDAKECARLKRIAHELFPFFDTKALDAARFFFGTQDPQVEFFDGSLTFVDFLDYYHPEYNFGQDDSPGTRTIQEGSRNATLSHFADRVLKRYGDTPHAYKAFSEEAARCVPPLEDAELNTIWHSALGFYRRISSQEGYVPPAEYNSNIDEDVDLRPEHLTDVDEAHVLVAAYRDVLRHNTATEFLVYDGHTWVDSEARAHGLVHELTERQIAQHAHAYHAAQFAVESAMADSQQARLAACDQDASTSEKEAVRAAKEAAKTAQIIADTALKKAEAAMRVEEAYHNFLLKCRNSGKIRGILEEAKTGLELDMTLLDADPFLLNTPGGEVDLRTEKIDPSDPAHFHTRITTAAPSTEGMDVWLDFLRVITCGDKELEAYLQVTSGEELVGRIYNENMRIKIGQGSNGKSTYTNSKLRVFGSYGGQISAETLTTGTKNWELAELRGKRLIVASELEEGMRLNTAFVKKICSTDPILGEKKHKDPFTFLPSHTVVLYTNHLPKVGSIDKGTWRRLTVIPFNAVIEGKSDIKNYTDYLVEHCGGAILQWMIDGAKRFIAAGFKIQFPRCVTQAIEAYRAASDWMEGFLSERCELGSSYEAWSGELYQVYRHYCDSIGEFKRSPQDFKTALRAADFDMKKAKIGTIIKGLRIRAQVDEFEDFLQ